MKSLEELTALKNKINQARKNEEDKGIIRIVIGMATCGLAAGAQPVMDAFVNEIKKRNLTGVKVMKTGCIGMCKLEPIVDVFVPGKEQVTYIQMTPEKAVRIVNDHIINKDIVEEFVVGSAEK